MAALKEIKKRINSITGTRKTTSAMKMVSSAKLHKAESLIANMLPYSDAMRRVMAAALQDAANRVPTEGSLIVPSLREHSATPSLRGTKQSPDETSLRGTKQSNIENSGLLHSVRNDERENIRNDETTNLNNVSTPVKPALVVFSSDASLCGAFNSNVFRETLSIINEYKGADIKLYTIGKKITDACRKTGVKVAQSFETLASKPDYGVIAQLGADLLAQFNRGEISRVELVYHHFRSAGSQELKRTTLLPVDLKQEPITIHGTSMQGEKRETTPSGMRTVDYIFEPTYEELLNTLIPITIKLQLYTALLDSNVSEHAARMVAMQTATDNADDLICELTIEYNKSRQQAITNELLDIVSGGIKN
ncbi:MAG: ATP synthase F1 subunit gamma [Tannerella sp.]|jgi:F-type H+-transporting ATPase subunit gamma|nr:ATP synthase F1 subunit gamma [Tannerella sp.]